METMVDRLRDVLVGEPVTEKRMFGGLCFMHRGNMLCGVMKDGTLMARVGKDLEAEARATLPGARDMDFTGKKMGGLLYVDEAATASEDGLRSWVAMCLRHARNLPPK